MPRKTKRAKLPPTVSHVRLYEDTSGCPAEITIGDYVFIGDCLGKPSVRFLRTKDIEWTVGKKKHRMTTSFSQSYHDHAIVQARRDYEDALQILTTSEWRARNEELYK